MIHRIVIQNGRRFLIAPGARGGEVAIIPFSRDAAEPRNDEEMLTDAGVLCLWDKHEGPETIIPEGDVVGSLPNPQVSKAVRYLRRFDYVTRYLPKHIAAICGKKPFTTPEEPSAWS